MILRMKIALAQFRRSLDSSDRITAYGVMALCASQMAIGEQLSFVSTIPSCINVSIILAHWRTSKVHVFRHWGL